MFSPTEMLRDAARRLALADERPGTRVLRSRWPVSMEIVGADGTRVTSVAAGAGSGGELRLRASQGDRWVVEQEMLGGKRLGGDMSMSAPEAGELYRKMRRQLLANAPFAAAGGAGWRWGLGLVAALVIYGALQGGHTHGGEEPGHHSQDATAKFAPAPPATGAATAPPAGADVEPRATPAEMTMLKALAARSGLTFGDKGTPFYVFSDPNCPYCQKLERTLEQIGEGHRPVIIPVAYKPGSKEIVQGMLCTKDPKAAAQSWRSALAGTPDTQPAARGGACEEGLAKLTDNMTLFEMMKLTGTPAVISSSGRMFSGASGATVEQLRAALELP